MTHYFDRRWKAVDLADLADALRLPDIVDGGSGQTVVCWRWPMLGPLQGNDGFWYVHVRANEELVLPEGCLEADSEACAAVVGVWA